MANTKKYEKSNLKYFNSMEAARILGVNVSTIKRWTDSGELNCIRTAGGHRKFLPEHLNAFMEQHRRKNARMSLLPVEETADVELTAKIFAGDMDFLQDEVLKQALAGDVQKVLFVLSGMISVPRPLHEIYDELITPVLHHLGTLWEEEQISVIEEHFASQCIRLAMDRLQALLSIPRKKIGSALCMNLSSELHDIPLQMVGHILEHRGFRVLYAGQMTPFMGIEDILPKMPVERIYISSTFIPDFVTAKQELRQIIQISMSHNIKLFVGGQGFDRIDMEWSEGVKRLYNFKEVYQS